MKRKLALLLLLLPLLALSCGRVHKALQIKGSDTMVNLAQAWAEEYMNLHPAESVAVTGGGSGTGIAALISNATDIAQSSRNMEAKEIKQAEARGVEPKELHVASDGISVVVHPSNPISKITIPQISDIFTGKIRNWKELGGEDSKIVALSRERNSGTHVFFLEHVVKLGNKKNPNEFAPDVLMMPSSQAIVEEVRTNPQAVGYIGLGYLTNKEKALFVAKDKKNNYVYPTIVTVIKGEYPISRSLLFYTNGKPNLKVKPFLDFVLSPVGQKIVLKMDFVPIRLPEAPKK